MTKKIPPLDIQEIKDTTNLHYLSIIEYRKDNHLVVINNITEEEITAYSLDAAQPSGIDINNFLSVVTYWFYGGRDNYPLSFEFAKRGLTAKLAPIYRSFDINHVSRVVGVPFEYNLAARKTKRRKAVPITTMPELTFGRK